MKTVSLMVEFVVSINDDVDPNDVTFDIPTQKVKVQSVVDGKRVGVLKSYCTQEYVGE